MSDSEIRLPLAEARARAETLLGLVLPYCVKAAIVGSVRRERKDCGDVELLALPRPGSSFEDGV